MTPDDQFCPECDITLDLHDEDGEGCEAAQMKANMLDAFDRMIGRVVQR